MRPRRLILLAAACQVCRARRPVFSIHDDLDAYPQFEVAFANAIISEPEAQALLLGRPTHDASYPAAAGSQDRADVSYELMMLRSSRYLCSIPAIVDDDEGDNSTTAADANELASAEAALELSRASAHGWDLVSRMNGQCLFYMSGWWSYRFCFNRDVVQFHALPLIPNNAAPPVRDQTTPEYVLGRASHAPASTPQRSQSQLAAALPQSQLLQLKGDQRYLAQKYGSGTVCDLTGRDRTIDIQYHCTPGTKSDRIDSIKEVTTCTYLMIIQTPRLCADPAFLPPRENVANPISCRLIAPQPNGDEGTHSQAPQESSQAAVIIEEDGGFGMAMPATFLPFDHLQGPFNHGLDAEREAVGRAIVVGGTLVGGRKVIKSSAQGGGRGLGLMRSSQHADANPAVGRMDFRLSGLMHGARNQAPDDAQDDFDGDEDQFYDDQEQPVNVQVIAQAESRADGGRLLSMTAEELEQLDLSPQKVEELKQQLSELAGDNGWKLELLGGHDGQDVEMRGIVDVDLVLGPGFTTGEMQDRPEDGHMDGRTEQDERKDEGDEDTGRSDP